MHLRSYAFDLQSVSFYCRDRAMFKAAAAVQAVLLPDFKRSSRLDAVLRTVLCACPAADTFPGYMIPFFRNNSISHCVTFPEDRPHPQIEVFYLSVSYCKYNTDLSRISRIHV